MKTLRGQTADIELVEDETGDTIPVGILDNPELQAPGQTIEVLRGAGSTEIKDTQKTETEVGISGEVSAMALDAWDKLIDYDDVEGKLDDSADVKYFVVTFTFEAADGSTKEVTAEPAWVNDNVTFGGSREDWIGMDIDMTAVTITDITNTDAAA